MEKNKKKAFDYYLKASLANPFYENAYFGIASYYKDQGQY